MWFNTGYDYAIKQYEIIEIESNGEEVKNALITYEDTTTGETQKYYYEKENN